MWVRNTKYLIDDHNKSVITQNKMKQTIKNSKKKDTKNKDKEISHKYQQNTEQWRRRRKTCKDEKDTKQRRRINLWCR
jgi:hypothetical protein